MWVLCSTTQRLHLDSLRWRYHQARLRPVSATASCLRICCIHIHNQHAVVYMSQPKLEFVLLLPMTYMLGKQS